MTDEKKKRVLVTGASSGIGAEIAKLLGGEPAHSLLLVARTEDKLKKITEEIKKKNKAECEYFVSDLSKEAEVARLTEAYPEVDILVNNAGFAGYGFYHDISWGRIKGMIMVNVLACCRLCHHYLPGMMERDFGRILNVASTAGLTPIPFMSSYAATKAFLIQFSKSLAIELKGRNVTVSCLMPGPTDTNFWHASKSDSRVKSVKHRYARARDVAKFGIRLMENGEIAGIPGLENKLKEIIKSSMPKKVWYRIIRKHMMKGL